MDDLDDMLELQDEVMEEDYHEEEDYDMPYEEEDDVDVEINEQEKEESALPSVSTRKLTARDIDMDVFPESSRFGNSSSGISEKKKTPEEFAKYMQEIRMATVGFGETADKATTSLFVLANQYMHEISPVCKLSLREVAGCTTVAPQANRDNGYCSMVLSNSRRVYLLDRAATYTTEEALKQLQFDPYQKNLLSVSYHELTRQVDEIETQKRILTQRLVENQIANDRIQSKKVSSDIRDHVDADKELWVDKYAPNSFTQLLSAEKTNRDVLKALKRWDRYVFKREVPTVKSSGNDAEDDAAQKKLFAEDGRPRNKVIMLCGPPGTGKTTLAHVAAIHCGYRPVEVNASDDRSPDALKEMLARATQNATLDNDKRPNCIIFDEIDGMDGNKKALEILLDVIRAPLAKKSLQAKTSGRKTGAKTASDSFALTRPLICICNDQYAPVLRDLRKLSDIFVFSLPSESRLSQRLKHICQSERIDVTRPTVLSELISVTGHDIRSTINNLQFAAMKAKDNLIGRNSHSALSSTSLARMDLTQVIAAMMQTGLKDDQLDSFQVWQRIFSTRPPASSSMTSKERNTSKIDSQLMLAINAMQDHGDYDHLIAGIHENIIPKPAPQPKFSQQIGLPPPPSIMNTSAVGNIMAKFSVSYDWLSHCDTMMEGMRVMSDGFQLMPHVAVVGGAVHFCHAVAKSGSSTSSNMRFEWPRKDREVFYARQQRLNILELFQQQFLQRAHSSMLSKQAVSVDCVSSLLDLFTPRVRPLPMLSLSHTEKTILNRIVQVMESCGVSYTPLAVADEKEAAEMLGQSSTQANKQKFFGKQPFSKLNREEKGKYNNGGSIFLQDNIIMVLEPNLSLLVRYNHTTAGSEELRGRHHSVSAELRNVIFTEQRKFAIAQWESRVAERAKEQTSTSKRDDAEEDDQRPYELRDDELEGAASSLPNSNATHGHGQSAASTNKHVPNVNPWERPGHEEEEEAKRARGSLSSFLVKRPASTTAKTMETSSKKLKLGSNAVAAAASETVASATAAEKVAPVVAERKKYHIVFKFNQGYSNAVRRPVYLRDFVSLEKIRAASKGP